MNFKKIDPSQLDSRLLRQEMRLSQFLQPYEVIDGHSRIQLCFGNGFAVFIGKRDKVLRYEADSIESAIEQFKSDRDTVED